MTIIHLLENINNNNNFAKKVNYPFNNTLRKIKN
jgi:hypothetical protein